MDEENKWILTIVVLALVAFVLHLAYLEFGAEVTAIYGGGFLAAALLLLLAFFPWFWMIVFYLGSAACFLTMLAFAVHFQILPALGLCVLGVILGFIGRVIGVAYYRLNGFF